MTDKPQTPAGVIPWEVWDGWVSHACEQNEYVADESRVSGAPALDRPISSDDPGTDFNHRGTWADTGILDAGWSWCRRSADDRGTLTRPGKERGVSATVGMVTSKANGWPLFWCFSTSVPEFKPEVPYTRFGVYAILHHAGDFKAAARALADRGYGQQPAIANIILSVPTGLNGSAGGGHTPQSENAPPTDRPFLWMSELRFRPVNDKWLWKGYLSRGGVTLLSAFWKAGKSTLLAHLIRALDGRADQFCGLEIVPSRVLYVTEEDQETWAERRDALGIGDHVGMINRPFIGRPNAAQWAAFLGTVQKAVAEYRFDLVAFDTLSKLWPVREENDAGQVEDALMPLWGVTNLGASLLLVHHARKSDGGQFTSARGSGGLSAFAETLIELRRNSEDRRDSKRVLTAAGRYTDTPAEWLVELTPAGYVGLGDPDDPTVRVKVNLPTWRDRLDGVLPDEPPGLTVEAIHEALKKVSPDAKSLRDQDLRYLLNARVDGGEYMRLGKGTKGNPFWYCRVSIPDSSPKIQVHPLGSQRETNSGGESGD